MGDKGGFRLHSPVGAEPLKFGWPLITGTGKDRHDAGQDIVDTVRWVCEEMPEIQATFEGVKFHEIDTSNYNTMKDFCDRFNNAIDTVVAMERGTSLPSLRYNYPSRELLKHILQQVYNFAVAEPEKLNQYEPFSPEVYGETSYDLIAQMIDLIEISGEDTFVDLGSGVGQVILQMAASKQLKFCIGIEKADVPSRYAENMDTAFQTWMKWFGKKYNDYKLIKGDFLADEHREKINSATIVFVNNYAFGPVVDHSLKERFADLKDGARIVSSQSFCPLNFRITDRNLSDIGTIMHVSEMSSLRGSVSWTGNPVSYYLHVIDRTKLECYFERLKTKGANGDNGENGSRSRDKGKRMTLMDDSTTDTDGDGHTGPTTRRAWSDQCKGRSSQSDDDDRRNSSVGPNKKRRKITRQKTATQTNRSLQAAQATKKAPRGPAKGGAGVRKGGKARRPLKNMQCLELLHNHTLMSTSDDAIGKRLPPAAGCVDQQLTSISGNMLHEELEIPVAPLETPYALQILMDVYKQQFMAFLEQMREPSYKENLHQQIDKERDRNNKLLNRAGQLEKQIRVLIDDSVTLLKARMNELGINTSSQNDLLCKAKEIVGRHKELQGRAAKLQTEVNVLEQQQNNLVTTNVKKIAEKYIKNTNIGLDFEFSTAMSYDIILKEMTNTLAQRKKLQAQVSSLESDIVVMEKTTEERKVSVPIPNPPPTVVQIQPTQPPTPQQLPPAIITPQVQKHHSRDSSSKHRKNRENRTRSQEWPDIPDVGKIEESNPEVLAQKILETGRQIEAGRLRHDKHDKKSHPDSALMPAPAAVNKSHRQMQVPPPSQQQQQQQQSQQQTQKIYLQQQQQSHIQLANSQMQVQSQKVTEKSPHKINFEDRLKNFISSALQDQEHAPGVSAKTIPNPVPVPPQIIATPIMEHKKREYPTQPPQNMYHHQTKVYMQQSSSRESPVLPPGTHHLNPSTTITPTNVSPYKQHQNKISPPTKYPTAPQYAVAPPPSSKGMSISISPTMAHDRHLSISPNGLMYHQQQAQQQQQQQQQQHHQMAAEYHHQQQQRNFETPGKQVEFKPPPDAYRERVVHEARGIPEDYGRDRYTYVQVTNQPRELSRPSSSSSQPDYTQVSPAKMALRRHLSQEKIGGNVGPSPATAHPMSKTIGDLVNGEIERTLEISNQKIIDAAVNMSTLLNATAANNHTVINTNIQRPERVSVRVMEEAANAYTVPNAAYSPISRPNSRDLNKSPISQSNLATLAHVAAYSQQKYPTHGPRDAPGASSSKLISPRQQQQANSTTVAYQRSDVPRNGPPGQYRGEERYMPLPRAEMKPYLESYFTDDYKPHHLTAAREREQLERRSMDERRMRDDEKPLEGLAASLQARMMASIQIKEEADERRRLPSDHAAVMMHQASSSIKTEGGLKRTSPIVQSHSRPPKMLYADVPDSVISQDMLHPGRPGIGVGPLMSPEINSMTADDRHMVIRLRHDDGMLSSSSSSACSSSRKKSKKKKKNKKKHKHKKKSHKRDQD